MTEDITDKILYGICYILLIPLFIFIVGGHWINSIDNFTGVYDEFNVCMDECLINVSLTTRTECLTDICNDELINSKGSLWGDVSIVIQSSQVTEGSPAGHSILVNRWMAVGK